MGRDAAGPRSAILGFAQNASCANSLQLAEADLLVSGQIALRQCARECFRVCYVAPVITGRLGGSRKDAAVGLGDLSRRSAIASTALCAWGGAGPDPPVVGGQTSITGDSAQQGPMVKMARRLLSSMRQYPCAGDA